MYCIGIDIGGTSVKAGIVDRDGKILKKESVPTDVAGGSDKIISDIARLILSLADPADSAFAGVGIGCPGAVNSGTGVVDRAYNLKWHKVALAEKLFCTVGKPIKVSNDANAAALGETMFGVSGKYRDTVFLTLGTGVGGGIVLNGRLYEGNEGKGAELGHVVIDTDGELCSCGRRGCLEAYCSATALIRDTKKAMEQNKDSLMWKFSPELDKVDGRTAFECSKKGDKTAEAVVGRFVMYLGEGILNFANIFRPQAVILGGGVCAQGDYLISKLKDYCMERNYGFADTPHVDILTAKLGNDAGIIGAAGMIFAELD